MKLRFDEETYMELSDDYAGICEECGATRSTVEPDAEGYECEDCGEFAVVGADIYLMRYAG